MKVDLATRLARNDAGLSPLDEPAAPAGAAAGGAAGGASAAGPIGTLVVCPMSVLSNWEMQLEEHVKEGALKVTEGESCEGRVVMFWWGETRLGECTNRRFVQSTCLRHHLAVRGATFKMM